MNPILLSVKKEKISGRESGECFYLKKIVPRRLPHPVGEFHNNKKQPKSYAHMRHYSGSWAIKPCAIFFTTMMRLQHEEPAFICFLFSSWKLISFFSLYLPVFLSRTAYYIRRN